MVSVVVLVAACALIPVQLTAWRALVFASLALVVFLDLFWAGRVSMDLPDDAAVGTVLAAYYCPSGAAEFLKSKGGEEPSRYFGYAPQYEEGANPSAPLRFAEPLARALEVNNQAMMLGLQNIQGYDPTHISRYDEYARAMNGFEQDYHHVDFFAEAPRLSTARSPQCPLHHSARRCPSGEPAGPATGAGCAAPDRVRG